MKGEIPTDHTIDPIGYAQGLITPKMKEQGNNSTPYITVLVEI